MILLRILFIGGLLWPPFLLSQNLGIGTISPAAALDVVSTESGILVPRLSTAQRDLVALSAGLDGLLIYNTTTDQFEYYDHGEGWQAVGGGASADNLGNHIATQNLQLNGAWLSGDGGNEGLFINSVGQVGIGNNNPSWDLQVDGNAKIKSGTNTGYLQIAEDWVGDPGWGTAGIRIGMGSDYMYVGMKEESSLQKDAVIMWADDTEDMLRFVHYHYAYGENERMRIDGNGVVRINDLAGTGTRMVVADGNGDLSTQSLSSGGADDHWERSGDYVSTYREGSDQVTRVGINTTNPSTALHISANGSDSPLRIEDLDNYYSSNTVLTTDNDGYIYKRNGAFFFSDLRFKKEIQDLPFALDQVLQLRGVSYLLRTDEYPSLDWETNRTMGLIAQEVETILPDLVHTDDNGYKAVNYIAINALLIESIKTLQAENDSIKDEITALHNQLSILTERLDQLLSGH